MIIVLLFIGIRFVILVNYKKLELDDIEQTYQRHIEAIERTVSKSSVLVLDWSHWNDLYNYLEGTNTKFYDDNLSNTTIFSDAEIEYILLFDKHNKLVVSRAFNPQSKKQDHAPSFIIDAIRQNPILLKHESSENASNQFLATKSGIYLFSAGAVTKTDKTGMPNGTVIMGYKFDQARTDAISKTILVPVQLMSLNIPKKDISFFNPILRDLFSGKKYSVVEINNDLLDIYLLLKDANDKPISLFKLTMPRSTYIQGLQTSNQFLWIVSVIAILIILLSLFALKRVIIDRILQFKKQLDDVITSGDFTKSIHISGVDELTDIVNTNNNMLKTIDASQKKLTNIIENLNSLVEQRTQELDKSFSLIQATMDSAKEGIIATDTDLNVITFNKVFLTFWQFESNTLSHHSFKSIIEIIASRMEYPDLFSSFVLSSKEMSDLALICWTPN